MESNPTSTPPPADPVSPTDPVAAIPAQPVSPADSPSNKGLSITGLLLAIFMNIVGLIISIIALVKSKKAGEKNGIALAGVIVGGITTLSGVVGAALITAFLFTPTGRAVVGCSIEYSSSVIVDDEVYDCETLEPIDGSSSGYLDEEEDVTGSEVVVNGSTVESACWSFTLPEDYIISPYSKGCQAELRLDNGTSTGVAATAITIKSQVGENSIDDFFEKVRATEVEILKEERLTIDSTPAGRIIARNSLGIPTDMYFIPYDSHLYSGNRKITSVLIGGPAASETQLKTIVDSLVLK